MTFPVSHKTVFVFDHGSTFHNSCQQNMEFDIFTKNRQSGIVPLAPLSKSLWTSCVEAAIEYCRIVWDIFPTDKLIRFIVSNTAALLVNTWSKDEQNLNHLMTSLAQVGPPSPVAAKDCNVLHGLDAAIEALCQCSEIQHEKRTSLSENALKVINKGRVICFTNFSSDSEVKSVTEYFQQALMDHNKIASSSDSLMTIQQCELVLMNVYPINKESNIAAIPKKMLSAILSAEVHNVKSSRHLAAKLGILVQQHYNLASTTVTGIPMKEEQNAQSSANYDVELLHPSQAHSEVFKTGVVNTEGVYNTTLKEGNLYETITLKWCTPRSSSVELHYCSSAFRITPVDVNNRPSSCLTNFLLNGRAVMLEMPRKSGSKILSHMLSSHGGEIFIHSLGSGRSTLEDPPSISEGAGGRVTDYRINDFGDFMKQNKLAPCDAESDRTETPVETAKKRLSRLTQYWPMVFGHTTIFNMSAHIGPLLQLITKETLDSNEVLECRKAIYSLVSCEGKGLPLPVPAQTTRGKGPKREEHYRLAWNELEAFVRCHCLTSEHKAVLECVLECRSRPEGDAAPASLASIKSQLGVTPGESDAFPDKKRSLEDFIGEELGRLRRPPAKAVKKLKLTGIKGPGTKSLLDLYTDLLNAEYDKRFIELEGRLNGPGGPSKLYQNLKLPDGTPLNDIRK